MIIRPEDVDYNKLVEDYGLNDKRDIVWMKFSKEQYFCTVACSNDINVEAIRSIVFHRLTIRVFLYSEGVRSYIFLNTFTK